MGITERKVILTVLALLAIGAIFLCSWYWSGIPQSVRIVGGVIGASFILAQFLCKIL